MNPTLSVHQPAGDPFTEEIIWSSLAAIGDEMFTVLRKTAMSAIIYEVLDMGTGITDANGQLAASGCGIPGFIAIVDKAVRHLVAGRGVDSIRPGDMFITNDPYAGGVTHLNDVALLLPVFAEGRLVAWVGNIAHWSDVGGMTPGSMATGATDIFSEGVRVPAVKLFDGGRPIESVFEILKANSRLPDTLEGDLWAGIAAARVGEQRIQELAAKYGTETMLAALDGYQHHGEQRSLAGLENAPKGRHVIEERQESGDLWRATVDISDESFIVDLRDNPAQSPGPYNLSRDGAVIAAQMLFKAVTDPSSVCNGGSLRPLQVLTRPGSIFDPAPPAAHGFYFETRIRLHDLLWRCLAPQMPDRLGAGGFASICATVLGGAHPDTGRPFTIVEPQIGGWGAQPDRDGVNAMFSGVHGETYNCPVEISEARHGLIVDRLQLNEEPGGEGQHRGGRGIVVDYRIRTDDVSLTAGFSRSTIPPWGMNGGADGSPNYVEIRRADGGVERHALITGARLFPGDVVRIVTGNGGGYGDPTARDHHEVEADLRSGLLSPEVAASVYGVGPDARFQDKDRPRPVRP